MTEGPNAPTGAREPSAWGKWKTVAKTRVRDAQGQAAFDFGARWRFAASFDGVKVTGYQNSKIVDGYHALLRLVIVCTAREQLAKVLKVDTWDLELCDMDLASAIHKNLYKAGDTKFAHSLMKGATGRPRQNLETFGRGETSDVQPLALAIRNGVAHGTLTPSGSGIDGHIPCQLILRLGTELLNDSDQRFRDWVENQSSSAPENNRD